MAADYPSRFGRPLHHLALVNSTNDLARAAARDGAGEGLLILADEQTTGRGRRGRIWVAPPESAILASLLLRPRVPRGEGFAPTMILGLAIRAAVVGAGAPAVLKWPNDVLCRGRKMAGILCEAALGPVGPEFVVAGFGVNLTLDPAALGLTGLATSLAAEMGVNGPPPDRMALLQAILGEAERRYDLWQGGDYEAIWGEWRAGLATLGNRVRIEQGDGPPVEGEATDVTSEGALLVRTPTGLVPVVTGTIE